MSQGLDPTSRWQSVKELMQAALDLDSEARVDFVRQRCGDAATTQEVLSLLAAHDAAGDFLEVGPDSSLLGGAFVPGERVGAYRIDHVVGEGGMGTVYQAERADGEFRKRVALKVVREGIPADALEYFRTERQLLADIDHPYIARLLDGGTTDEGLPYFVMEYIDGEPIDAYCDREGLDVRGRLELFRRVCDAVQHAHELQVVHRDLKPGNVLVTSTGVPKLLDFGLATLLEVDPGDGEFTGPAPRAMTPAVASPEQIAGDLVTPASDVYSLGMLLYVLVCGRRPYSVAGKSWPEVKKTVCEATVPLPSQVAAETMSADTPAPAVERDLDSIILKALAKDPAARHANAGELSAALTDYLLETDPARVPRAPAWGVQGWAAAAAILVATGLLIWSLASGLRPAPVRTLRAGEQRPLVTWASPERSGRISPDGRLVAFSSRAGPLRRLWIAPTKESEGEARMLVEDYGLDGHVWAPDSTRIAYLISLSEGPWLNIIGLEGSDGRRFPLQMDNPELVRWREDTVYVVSSGTLWSVDLRSGDSERVATGPGRGRFGSVDVHPSRGRIVYTARDERDQTDIWVANIDGSNAHRITDDEAYENSVQWFGDSDDILFRSGSGARIDTRVISEDGRNKTSIGNLAAGYTGFDVSADGSWLAADVEEEHASLEFVDDDGTLEPLTHNDLPDFLPSPARGSSLMGFQRARATPEEVQGPFDADIFLIDPTDGDSERRVVQRGFAPALSPDGRRLAYLTRSPEAFVRFDLHVLELGSGNRTFIDMVSTPEFAESPLAWGSLNVAWGADGRSLYYVRVNEGGHVLMQMGAGDASDAAEELQGVAAPALILEFDVSPDQRYITYVVRREPRAPGTALFLWDREERAASLLEEVQDGRLFVAGWMNDSSFAVVHREPTAEGAKRAVSWVRGVAQEGRSLAVIEDALPATATLDRARDRLLMTATRDGIANVYAINLDGSDPYPITRNSTQTDTFGRVGVTHDGRLVVSRETGNSNVWVMSVVEEIREP